MWIIRRVKIPIVNLKTDIQHGPVLWKQAFHVDLAVRILHIERIDALKTVDKRGTVLVLKKSVELHFSLNRKHSVLTWSQNRIELLCSGANIDIKSSLLWIHVLKSLVVKCHGNFAGRPILLRALIDQ